MLMLHAGSFSQKVFGYFASFHTNFGPLGEPESNAPRDLSVNRHINIHAFLQHHKLLHRSQPENLYAGKK